MRQASGSASAIRRGLVYCSALVTLGLASCSASTEPSDDSTAPLQLELVTAEGTYADWSDFDVTAFEQNATLYLTVSADGESGDAGTPAGDRVIRLVVDFGDFTSDDLGVTPPMPIPHVLSARRLDGSMVLETYFDWGEDADGPGHTLRTLTIDHPSSDRVIGEFAGSLGTITCLHEDDRPGCTSIAVIRAGSFDVSY